MPGTRPAPTPLPAAQSWRSLVRALAAVRTVPVRLAVALVPAGAPDRPRDAGMTTAEYAVGTLAACGFAGVLYKLVTSPEVLGLLRDVITRALKLSF